MDHAADRAQRPSRGVLLIDAAVAIAVFAASLALVAVGTKQDGDGHIDAAEVALAAVASLPLAARRLAPISVFVLTAMATAVLRGVGDPFGPPIGPTLALYWMVAAGEESRGRTRLMLGLVVAMLLTHLTAAGLAQDRFPLTESLFGVLVWSGAWLAGDRSRLREERMAELEERALRAERDAERERRLAAAEERTRIARDLHDSAGHAINVILVHAGLGRLRTGKDSPETRQAFETIEEVARETVAEIDQLVRVLRDDSSGSESDAKVEPPPGVAAIDGLVERHRAAGMDVTATVGGDVRPLPPGVDRGAYHILKEALTNAARHGGGATKVQLDFGRDALELTVANPLRGDRPGRPARGGHGIIGMRERAAMLGGTLRAAAEEGRFRVYVRLPLAGRPG